MSLCIPFVVAVSCVSSSVCNTNPFRGVVWQRHVITTVLSQATYVSLAEPARRLTTFSAYI